MHHSKPDLTPSTRAAMTAALMVLVMAGGLILVSRAVASDHAGQDWGGAYLGLATGQQNIYGGSLLNGVDVLAESGRTVTEAVAGYRHQFAGGIVIGVELRYGSLDGDLVQKDVRTGSEITYSNDRQLGYGGSIGYALRESPGLVYFYAFETERDFDVTIQNASGTFQQSDEQGGLRYGLGFARRISDQWQVNLSAGLVSADFGNRPTNGVDVEDDWEFSVGFNYAF